MEGYWMVRTIRSGRVIEKTQFYVGERKPRADRRKGSSSRAKMEGNKNAAVRTLARILNCNMAAGDLLITLSYDEAHLPADGLAADKQAALFWRRISRHLQKQGVKICGFWQTADKDAETGDPVRLHHHLVIKADGCTVDFDEDGKLVEFLIGTTPAAKLWKNGTVNVELLRDQQDYTAVAAYLVRQAAERPDGKKWHSAKGMEKPVVERELIVAYPKELRAPGGAKVQEIGHYDEASGGHYIRYIRKPRTPKIGGHKERAIEMGEEATP